MDRMSGESKEVLKRGLLNFDWKSLGLALGRADAVKLLLQGNGVLWGTSGLLPPGSARVVSAHLGEGPACLFAFPSLKLRDCFGREKIFESGEEEYIPGLSFGLELLQELDRRRVHRDARDTILRGAHVPYMV
jgi:hypothetical protein